MMRIHRSSVVLGLLLAAAACQNDQLNRPFSVTANVSCRPKM